MALFLCRAIATCKTAALGLCCFCSIIVTTGPAVQQADIRETKNTVILPSGSNFDNTFILVLQV